MSEFDWYERSEVHRFFSSGQNFNPMPTGYQARFDEVLAGFGDSDAASLTADLAEISEQDVPETMRVALGLARIGQGRFRANVMSLWGHGEQCALTGLALPELLVASHIKPWRESSNVERLDKWNGLLLAAHVDKLFDRYLMTFERRGGEFKCLLHTRARDVARKLGIADGVSSLNCSYLSSADVARIDAYLELHRSVFRTRIANERLARPPDPFAYVAPAKVLKEGSETGVRVQYPRFVPGTVSETVSHAGVLVAMWELGDEQWRDVDSLLNFSVPRRPRRGIGTGLDPLPWTGGRLRFLMSSSLLSPDLGDQVQSSAGCGRSLWYRAA